MQVKQRKGDKPENIGKEFGYIKEYSEGEFDELAEEEGIED